MAAPTAPTLSSICTEALKKAGYTTTSSRWTSLLSRAQDEWMEEVKAEIWTRHKRLKSLQSSAIITTVIGRSRYSFPTDFSSLIDKEMDVMYGSITGTAQAGAVNTITLAASFSDTETNMQGKEIAIISGTGANQISQIYAYNNTTKVASIYPSVTTAPAVGSGYMIIDSYSTCSEKPIWDFDSNISSGKGSPCNYYPMGDADDGEFLISPIPDKTYVLRLYYYADLKEIDLAGTLMATLYKNWRNVFVQGVFAKALQEMDEARYVGETQTFYNLLNIAMSNETYLGDSSNIIMHCEEEV
jgi:hypothetical protein